MAPSDLALAKLVQELVDSLRDDLVTEVRSLRDSITWHHSQHAPTPNRKSVDVEIQTVENPLPKVQSKGLTDSPSFGIVTQSSAPWSPPNFPIQEVKAMSVPSPCRTCRKVLKAPVQEKDAMLDEVQIARQETQRLIDEVTKLGQVKLELHDFQKSAVDAIVAGVRRATTCSNRDQQFEALDAELSAHCRAHSNHETIEPEARRKELSGYPVAAFRGQWAMMEEVRRLQEELRRVCTRLPEHSTSSSCNADVLELRKQQLALVNEINESRREFRDLAEAVRRWQVLDPKLSDCSHEHIPNEEPHGDLANDIRESQRELRDLALDVCHRQDGFAAKFGGDLQKVANAAEETIAHKSLVEDVQRRQGELEHLMKEEFRKVRAALGAGLAALGASSQSPPLKQQTEGCSTSMAVTSSLRKHTVSPAFERPTPCRDRVLHRV